jgi:low temperature requirement protein LtrA
MTKAYLLFIAIGLVPIALSYGANPAGMLPKLLKFNVETPNETQVFRAVMCLYLATSAFWLMGALLPEWQRAALIWAVFFMLSLALGRFISMAVDGMPTAGVLNLYLAVELGAGALGLWLLCNTS